MNPPPQKKTKARFDSLLRPQEWKWNGSILEGVEMGKSGSKQFIELKKASK